MAQAMDFLEVMETLRAEEASTDRLFGDLPRRRHRNDPTYQKRLAEAAATIRAAQQGNQRARYYLSEVMTTSDFSQLSGDLMGRMLRARYSTYTPIWSKIARKRTVNDFRPVRSTTMNDLGGFLPEVAEQAEYPATQFSDAGASWQIKKHGERVPFSWELAINDDLNAFERTPEALGQKARRSEDWFMTNKIAGATGPNAAVYNGGNANVIPNNPPLSLAGIQAGLLLLHNMVDAEGNPILFEGAILMVPRSQKLYAESLLGATKVTIKLDANTDVETKNPAADLELVVNPWLQNVSATNGATSWYLFAAPTGDHPVMDMGFLAGHEEPEIWMKSPNAVNLSGAAIDPMQGDFDTDTIQYRIRHCYGGDIVEAKATVASNGTGA